LQRIGCDFNAGIEKQVGIQNITCRGDTLQTPPQPFANAMWRRRAHVRDATDECRIA
jgi:hypothetical protein